MVQTNTSRRLPASTQCAEDAHGRSNGLAGPPQGQHQMPDAETVEFGPRRLCKVGALNTKDGQVRGRIASDQGSRCRLAFGEADLRPAE